MKRRILHIHKGCALFFFCSILCGCLWQGCTEKKIYNLSEQSESTARMTFPACIQIGRFDGGTVGNIFTRILYEGEKEVIFPAGSSAVKIRYNEDWDIDDYDHEKIVSEYITLQFEAEPGKAYRLRVDVPKNRQSAWELATHFRAEIIDVQTGKTVSRPANDS